VASGRRTPVSTHAVPDDADTAAAAARGIDGAAALRHNAAMADGPPAEDAGDGQRYAALAARSRRRLLDVLRAASRPLDARDLAAAVGLHVTTARTHLRMLETAGLVVRTRPPPAGPGRPRQLYALAAADRHLDGHRELAELLAGELASDGDGGRRRAEATGRRWAEREVPDGRPLAWEDAVSGIGDLFGRLGFGPRRVDADPARYRVALERCPFRDVARAHPEVVCTVHLGLLRGVLSRVGQDGIAGSAQLRPFVTPDLCMAEIPGPGLA